MKRVEEQIAREAVFGILPVLPGERRYGFLDAFLVLSGYCIATWSTRRGLILPAWWVLNNCTSGRFSERF